jgi:hypothetical protein
LIDYIAPAKGPDQDRMIFRVHDSGKRIRNVLIMACLSISTAAGAATRAVYTGYNFNFGAKSLSMGNAFTAVADDLSAVFWNPAGLADILHPAVAIGYRMDSLSHSFDYPEEGMISGSPAEEFESSLERIDYISITVPARFWNVKWNFALSYYPYLSYAGQGSHEAEKTDLSAGAENQGFEEVFSGSGGIDVLAFSMALIPGTENSRFGPAGWMLWRNLPIKCRAQT